MSDKSDVQLITELIELFIEDRITADQEDKLSWLFSDKKGVSISSCLMSQIRVGAEHSQPLHQTLIGLMRLYGWGVAENEKEAVRLFRLSHEQGCAKGTFWYSRCHLWGQGMEYNREEGARLLQEAHRAHPRDARVTCMLADCYFYGREIEQNWEEAARLWLEAAYLGYSQAMFWAGRCFRYGEGVEEDLVEAARWFRRAVALGHKDAPRSLKQIQEEDAEAVNPYGDWEPRWGVHQWVSQKVRQEMMSALLVCKRIGIPNVVAVHCLLPFICSLPH